MSSPRFYRYTVTVSQPNPEDARYKQVFMSCEAPDPYSLGETQAMVEKLTAAFPAPEFVVCVNIVPVFNGATLVGNEIAAMTPERERECWSRLDGWYCP